MHILPKTRIGKAPVGLIVLMFSLFFLGRWFFLNRYASVSAGETILRDIVSRPGLALSMLSGFVAGVLACVVGLTAIIKHKERAVVTFIATVIGSLLTMFLVLDLVLPH